MLGAWQQQLFSVAVEILAFSGMSLPDNFAEDRAKMFDGGIDSRSLPEICSQPERLWIR